MILDDLHTIFSKVCCDFEAELIEFDGEEDHVHLLVNYPPKIAISSLVNSLKRMTLLSGKSYGELPYGHHPTSPDHAEAHPSKS